MTRIPKNRQPTHPGQILLHEFLIPNNISQTKLAENIKVPFQRINELVNQKRGITTSTALRLAKYFGNSPDFWLNLQLRLDLYNTFELEELILNQIVCLSC